MSTDTERLGEETDASVLESWRRWYHLPVIGVVMLFMAWVRLRPLDEFSYRDGRPEFQGVDSYYHWRTIEWTAENYPRTMPFDVWTGFPTGRYVGQFGTLFDQLIVTVAMIVGLGDPSGETLFTVSLVAVPVMAALVAVPVFYMGRRLGGTFAGVVSIVVLALAPGSFLSRSTAGQLDHHVAEVLFMAIAVLAMMVALRVAERERPIWELVVERDVDALRASAVYSGLAGVALALYVWVWPSAVLLVGMFGIFFAVHLSLDYLRGVSPDHVAFVGAVSLGIAAVLTTLLIEEPGMSPTSFGYLQPATALLVAIGCVFMAWLARQWNGLDLDRRLYPVAVAGLVVVAFAAMALVLPDLYRILVTNLTSRLFPLSPDAGTLTISEAQPPDDFTERVFAEFGAAFYTMLAGLVFLVARPLFGREYRAEYTLIVVWALFLTSMAATQVRFFYYLVLAVAVVNAVFVADLARVFDLDFHAGARSLRGIETYQVLVVFMVLLLLFAPLLPPLAAGSDSQVPNPVWKETPGDGPHPDSQKWDASTAWLAENTPEPGTYGGHDNADKLDYLGHYDYPDGADHAYPEGAYGVMSWWDYGHLITTGGERIPHANPFQQNADSASAFLTAESEERAELILDAIAAGANFNWGAVSNERLEAAAENGGDGEEMRYVMIDDSMAAGKFPAITEWSGPDYEHYLTPEGVEEGDTIQASELGMFRPTPQYYDTTLSRLYFDDANGMEHYRLVHENDYYTSPFVSYAFVDTESGEVLTEDVSTVVERRAGAEPGQQSEWEPQIVLNHQTNPGSLQQQYSALQQYGIEVRIFDIRQAPAVKTFERVEGATISVPGSADGEAFAENATARAVVELETDSGRTFNYTQTAELGEDGSFEIPVAYATNDELGVDDGYTDSSVEATGAYNVTVFDNGTEYETQVEVPETAVVEGGSVDAEDLQEVADDEGDDGNADDGNGSEQDGNEDGGDEEGSDENVDDENADGADANAPEADTSGE